MAQIVLFGATKFEKRLRYYIETETDDEVVAFCVDRDFRFEEEIDGIPVQVTEDLPCFFPPEEALVLVGIGHKDMNGLRMDKSIQLSEMGYSHYNFISTSARVDSSATLGAGNIIIGDAFIDYGVVLGNGNIVECGVHISHDSKIGNFNYFSPETTIGGEVTVGNRCFCGLNSTLRSTIVINDASLIGAGAYADKDLNTGSVVVPARSVLLAKKSFEMHIVVQKDS